MKTTIKEALTSRLMLVVLALALVMGMCAPSLMGMQKKAWAEDSSSDVIASWNIKNGRDVELVSGTDVTLMIANGKINVINTGNHDLIDPCTLNLIYEDGFAASYDLEGVLVGETSEDIDLDEDATLVKANLVKKAPASEPGEPEGGDPEGNDPESGDPEGNDPEGGDPEGGDPEGNDPEGGDPEGNDPEGNDPEGGNPEGNDPEGGDPEDDKDKDPSGKDESSDDSDKKPESGGKNEGTENKGDKTPEPTTFTIVVTKTDAKTSAALSGAEFALTDKAGNAVANWTTDGSAKTFTLDRNTSYVLTEVKAPAGYNREKAININFATVDGKAVVNIDQGSKVVALKNHDSNGNAILNVKDLNGVNIKGVTTTAQTGDSTSLPLVSLCFAGAALAAGAAASIAYRKKQQH